MKSKCFVKSSKSLVTYQDWILWLFLFVKSSNPREGDAYITRVYDCNLGDIKT